MESDQLFSMSPGGRMRSNQFDVEPRRFRLVLKNVLILKTVKHWERQPLETGAF